MPEAELAEIGERLAALGDCQEVVAGELADLARETDAAIGDEDLGLADPARIDDDLAGRRIAGVVLVFDAEVAVAEGDPAPLAAPADMDDPLAVGKEFLEGRAGFRRPLLLEPRLVGERAGLDPNGVHQIPRAGTSPDRT